LVTQYFDDFRHGYHDGRIYILWLEYREWLVEERGEEIKNTEYIRRG
jgi:hypothetical protein